MRRAFVIALLFSFYAITNARVSGAASADILGVVDNVRDGDTIRVKLDEGWRLPAEVRRCSRVYDTMAWVHLAGVKGPEMRKKEFCSAEAAQFTRQQVIRKHVKLLIQGCGQYNGLNAFVKFDRLGQDLSLNLELVKAGLATLHEATAVIKDEDQLTAYRIAENHAKSKELGVWGPKPCAIDR